MGELDIVEAIRHNLPSIFHRYPLTEFQFMKAVGDALVSPEILEWDFKTMKHVYQNGPVYIRITKPVKCFSSGEEDLDKQFDMDSFSEDENDDLDLFPKNEPCCSSKRTPSRVSHKVLCPICHQRFDQKLLESHADNCANRKFDFLKYSSGDDEGTYFLYFLFLL